MKMPPFKDAHMHFVLEGRPARSDELLKIMLELIRCGIFSVNDMGYKTGIGLEAKKLLKEASIPLTIRSAGYAVYKKGTYGVFLGRGISEKGEIKKIIDEISSARADFVKVVNSGIICSKGSVHITPGGFSFEELKIICSEAKERNLEVACHVNGDSAIKNAIEAGASSIEHGYFISDESLHLMKEKKISWTPTVFALLTYSLMLPLSERRQIEVIIDNHLSAINYASSIRLKLNIGTDSGSRGIKHGESFFDELQLFQKAGLSLEQILAAACMDDKEIKKGNYLIVKKDFIKTKKIEAVFFDNKEVK